MTLVYSFEFPVTNAYDLGGLLATTVQGHCVVPDHTLSYLRDAASGATLGCLLDAAGGGLAVTTSRDAAGRVTNLTAGVLSAAYRWDGYNAAELTLAVQGVPALRLSNGWNHALGLRTNLAWSLPDDATPLISLALHRAPGTNRIAAIGREDGSRRDIRYDPDGRLLAWTTRRPDGTNDPTRSFDYAYDEAGNVLAAGRATFEADAFNFHVVRRWNAIDLVGRARSDAQVVVDGVPPYREGERFVYTLPLPTNDVASLTNLTVSAVISGTTNDWYATETVTLRLPACPETIETSLAGVPVSDSLREYLFDARGQLRRVTDKLGAPRLQANYDYYPDGRRARKVVSAWSNNTWQVTATHQFLYDQWNLIQERITDHGSPITRTYTWGLDLAGQQDGAWGQDAGVPRHSASGATAGGIGGLLAITEVSGTSTNVLLPILDQVGTIHALVAAITNNVILDPPARVATYDYSPYGELIERTGAYASSSPFGFQSKYFDSETGFWYYGYRYYDARSCKWLSADPLQEAGGLNLTAFCAGDPVNAIDPLGLSMWSDREDRMEDFYHQGRPVSAFLYMFGVGAWNGFSFGMVSRQSRIEDALADGDITLGRYADAQRVNASISGVQLALTIGGAGQVATAARSSTTLAGVLGQGARIGGRIGFLGNSAEALGSRLVDGTAGVAHDTTWGQDARTVAGGTLGGAALGAGSAGLAYGANHAYASLLRTLDDFAAIRYAPRGPLQSALAAEREARIVYRAINAKDAARLEAGLGLEAKNPAGTWNVGEHVALGSGRAAWANDPWIATTRVLDVARGFDSGRGIIAIDLHQVPSCQLIAWELYPRVNGEAGIPYHFSIWQQEISVFFGIPREAILGFVK